MNGIKPTRSELARQAVLAAGKEIRSVNPKSGVRAKEGRGNFVTAGDVASEKAIFSLIKQYYPDDFVLSEETQSQIKDLLTVEHLWVIDPIDGTHNFHHLQNYSAVSVGYVEKGVLTVGAVFDPFRNELFFAELGKGAMLNDQAIEVGQLTDIHKATVGTDNSYDPEGTRYNMELFLKINPSPWVAMKGSSVLAMCEVACGRMDMYFQTCLQPWDNAVGMLIVREAGGVVKGMRGDEVNFLSPNVVVGNNILVGQFVTSIQ